MRPQPENKIVIFGYDNYRQFLKDVYVQSKASDAKFSFRYFARLAGFQSPNFLKRIIDGDRNLTGTSIERMIKALKLNKEESSFFRHLVLLNQAKSIDERQNHAEHLLSSQVYKKIYPLSEAQYKYYAHWYYIPLREMAGLSGFREDSDWISKQLIPGVSSLEIKNAISELLKLGLLERDKNSKLRQSQKDIGTTDQVTSSSLAQFHREMAKMGGDSIERIPREFREISAVTLGLSENSFKKIKTMIKDLQRSIVELADQDHHQERVYQVSFQLFPLTKKMGSSSD